MDRRNYVIVALLAVLAVCMFWPRPPEPTKANPGDGMLYQMIASPRGGVFLYDFWGNVWYGKEDGGRVVFIQAERRSEPASKP